MKQKARLVSLILFIIIYIFKKRQLNYCNNFKKQKFLDLTLRLLKLKKSFPRNERFSRALQTSRVHP